MITLELHSGTSIFGIVTANRIILAADSLSSVFGDESQIIGSKFVSAAQQPVKWTEGVSASVFWVHSGHLPKGLIDRKLEILHECLEKSTSEVDFALKVGRNAFAILHIFLMELEKQNQSAFNHLLDLPYEVASIKIGVMVGGSASVYTFNIGVERDTERTDGITFKTPVSGGAPQSSYARDKFDCLLGGYIDECVKFVQSNDSQDMNTFEMIAEGMRLQLEKTPEVSGYPIEFLDVLPSGEINRYTVESIGASITPEPPTLNFVIAPRS